MITRIWSRLMPSVGVSQKILLILIISSLSVIAQGNDPNPISIEYREGLFSTSYPNAWFEYYIFDANKNTLVTKPFKTNGIETYQKLTRIVSKRDSRTMMFYFLCNMDANGFVTNAKEIRKILLNDKNVILDAICSIDGSKMSVTSYRRDNYDFVIKDADRFGEVRTQNFTFDGGWFVGNDFQLNNIEYALKVIEYDSKQGTVPNSQTGYFKRRRGGDKIIMLGFEPLPLYLEDWSMRQVEDLRKNPSEWEKIAELEYIKWIITYGANFENLWSELVKYSNSRY